MGQNQEKPLSKAAVTASVMAIYKKRNKEFFNNIIYTTESQQEKNLAPQKSSHNCTLLAADELAYVCSFLNLCDMISLMRVCKHFNQALSQDSLWFNFCQNQFPDFDFLQVRTGLKSIFFNELVPILFEVNKTCNLKSGLELLLKGNLLKEKNPETIAKFLQNCQFLEASTLLHFFALEDDALVESVARYFCHFILLHHHKKKPIEVVWDNNEDLFEDLRVAKFLFLKSLQFDFASETVQINVFSQELQSVMTIFEKNYFSTERYKQIIEKLQVHVKAMKSLNSFKKIFKYFLEDFKILPNTVQSKVLLLHCAPIPVSERKAFIGEHIYKLEEEELAKCYIATFPLKEVFFPKALGIYFSAFKLPGEASLIDRIIERFARIYHEANKTSANSIFSFSKSSEGIYILSFSLIMLSTEYHSIRFPKGRQKMQLGDFKKNLVGVNDGENFTDEFLTKCFNFVVKSGVYCKTPSGNA